MARTGVQFIGTGLAQKYRALARQLPSQVRDEMESIAEDAKDDFEKTVATWSKPAKFEVVKRERSWTVTTDDEKFLFVDKGTRPHIIRPKNKPFLAFQANYTAKTVPRQIISRTGGKSGPYVYTKKEVHHPGTTARAFSSVIFEKFQKQVEPRIRAKLKAGVEAVGL